MKTKSYNRIDATEADYLYVEKSQLENAGNGLFTVVDIYKDEMIAVFKGEHLTENESKRRAANQDDRYFIIMPDGKILDSMHVACFAKYANDASLIGATFKNNAKIALDDQNNVGLIALRKIIAGSEIFCGYGKEYWKKWSKIF